MQRDASRYETTASQTSAIYQSGTYGVVSVPIRGAGQSREWDMDVVRGVLTVIAGLILVIAVIWLQVAQ
jgi:hypothetical protein